MGHVHPALAGVVTSGDLPGSSLPATAVGPPQSEAAVAALQRVSPSVQTRSIRRGSTAFVVQLGHDQPVALLAAAHLSRRRPHLPVTLCEGVAAIGPFVTVTGKPCLNCVDLQRRERDPGWTGFIPGIEPAAVTTVLAAAAFAAAEVLAFLDGNEPQTLGATIEITAAGRFRRKTWHPHPDCLCARVRR